MSVYVDKAVNKYGRMIMCHMLADTTEELHVMADKIGINKKWFQGKASTWHYDICKSKRDVAVKNGAIEINRRETVAIIKRLRLEKNKVDC